jgi:hypothetical protein
MTQLLKIATYRGRGAWLPETVGAIMSEESLDFSCGNALIPSFARVSGLCESSAAWSRGKNEATACLDDKPVNLQG